LAKGTTIGYKRIVSFPTVKASKVRLHITDAKACLVISNAGVYYAPPILAAPSVIRNQAGEITITPADKESVIYYTTDGSTPTPGSKKYKGPFLAGGKPEIRAIVYDPSTRRSGPETHEKFDISKKGWKIGGIDDEKAGAVLDGDPSTAWHQSKEKKMPQDMVIDLGKDENITGLRYLPDQSVWNPGIIAAYEFYVSDNSIDWKPVGHGEFPNIKNNPLWQVVRFIPQKARYIKLRAVKNAENTNEVGYAELDIITQ
jgi:alpha-L-fucosidase